jgi:hypothetical protein
MGTIQFDILTKSRSMNDGDSLSVNPFYKASVDDIKNNFQYAKDCYKKVFSLFVSNWVIKEAMKMGIVCDGNLETLLKNSGTILNVIKDYSISPIPNYLELKELVV